MEKRFPPFQLAISITLASALHANSDYYYPDNSGSWETITPENAGADSTILDAAIAYAGSNNSDALIVLKSGKIVVEQYWNSWDKDTKGPSYSAAKSVASVLVGQAIEDGTFESIDQPSSSLLEEWFDEPYYSELTLRHHLSMTTGFEERQFGLLLLQSSNSERIFATGETLEYPAGTRWWYNDAPYRLLFYMIEEASGQSLPQYSQSRLFGPLGMEDTTWVIREESSQGESIDNYQWLDFTARDAARFGLMALSRGAWNGEQIVSEDWIPSSTQPQYDFSPWYGRLWWLNGSDHHQLPGSDEQRSGPFAPDAPADMFAALGAFDQKIYLIPSLDLVVVRLGDAARESSLAVGIFDNLLLGRISRAFGYHGQEQPMETRLSEDRRDLHVAFPLWNGRAYRLERSQNLSEWEPVPSRSNLSGNSPRIEHRDSLEQALFYRLNIRIDEASD